MITHKKRASFIAVILLATTSLFAENPNLFASADAKTKETITQVDALISKKQYKSAFDKLGKGYDNEYFVAKKIEICDNYFAQSLMHRTFAVEDLEATETLDDIRAKNKTFNTFSFDPVIIVEDYETKHGSSAILEKSLGDYYCSVLMNYSNNWSITDLEIIQNSNKHYQTAYDANCFDYASLTNYIYNCLQIKDYVKAAELINTLFAINSSNVDMHYNLAYCYLQTEQYALAAKEGEVAAILYKDNVNYKVDSYLLCTDAMLNDSQPEKAKYYLDKILEVSPNSYQAYDKYIELYLIKKDYPNAAIYADKLFAVGPEKPGASQMVLQQYMSFNQDDELIKFFERNIKTYSKQSAALGNLYYHYAAFWLNKGNKELASKYINTAETNFIQAGSYSGKLKTAVDQIKTECNK